MLDSSRDEKFIFGAALTRVQCLPRVEPSPFFRKIYFFKIRSSTFVRPVFTLDDFNVSDVKCV